MRLYLKYNKIIVVPNCGSRTPRLLPYQKSRKSEHDSRSVKTISAIGEREYAVNMKIVIVFVQVIVPSRSVAAVALVAMH